MTRVDFYVLEIAGASNHDRMICRVVEKAWQRGHSVFVQCADDISADAFDDLLWSFQDTSFVPHAREGIGDPAPVVIGTAAERAPSLDVLVNLASIVPECMSSFERVIESAGYDDTSRAAARERYRYYQDRGFPLKTHKIAR
jgi:DNA polymerase-3 subunit chi